MMIQSFFSKIVELVPSVGSPADAHSIDKLKQDFLRHEAEVGGQLFGPLPEGRTRKFFCLDEKTLIWHEEWIDQNGLEQMQTTRYEVRSDCVVKSQDGKVQYQKVEGEELQRLVKAAKLYQKRVDQEIYGPIIDQQL